MASEYAQKFHGEMQDEINANDESDRLVAVWPLSSARSIDASQGRIQDLELRSAAAVGNVLESGPDQQPVLLEAEGTIWCPGHPGTLSR